VRLRDLRIPNVGVLPELLRDVDSGMMSEVVPRGAYRKFGPLFASFNVYR
jgi:hypothetical protein